MTAGAPAPEASGLSDAKPGCLPAALGGILGAIVWSGAVVVGGLGHGWIAPLLVGWLAIPGCALLAVALARSGSDRSRFAAATLGIACVADLLLVAQTQREGASYFERMGALAVAWLLAFAAWQLAALALLAFRGAGRAR